MPTSHTADCNTNVLFVAIEMSNSIWKLSFSTRLTDKPRLRDVAAGAFLFLLKEIKLAKKKLQLPEEAKVVSCYEAGRDGFWLHRRLLDSKIDNRVVDSSSIEVNRRQRRAKTDRLDAIKLLQMLVRWHSGESSVWSVVQPPTAEQEDARQLHRELETLKREQTRHNNRIKSLLVTVDLNIPINRHFAKGLDLCCQWDESPLPKDLKSRLQREFERMQLVNKQIRQLEKSRAEQVRNKKDDPNIERVRRLMQLNAIGSASSWLFVHEVFGWRTIKNRRQLGSLLGLTPTPYASGNMSRDQSISKAGNRRMRVMATEIAWCWLRYQPDSELSRWFQRRFGEGSKRQRRIGIIALSRKLMIALWKYLCDGEIPQGAILSDEPPRFSYTTSLT